MRFSAPLIKATFIKRYKRFFADALLEDGTQITAHCPNPGSMKGLQEEGQPCYLSLSDNPKRKLKYTLEYVQRPKSLVGVNTSLTNKLVHEALENGLLNRHFSIKTIKPEQKYGTQNSRIDFLLEESSDKSSGRTFLEVKNVTLKDGDLAAFPDSVTARGTKHLEELIEQKKQGDRAVMLYAVNRSDCTQLKMAEDIDPTYTKTFKKALAAGVEALAYSTKASAEEIYLHEPIEILT